MGLSKKLRGVVEDVVRSYVRDELDSVSDTIDSFANNLGDHLHRIEALEAHDILRDGAQREKGSALFRTIEDHPSQPFPGVTVETTFAKRVEQTTSKALGKIAHFLTSEGIHDCHGLSPEETADAVIELLKDGYGTSEHESLPSQVHKFGMWLRSLVFLRHPMEQGQGESDLDYAIRVIRKLMERVNDLSAKSGHVDRTLVSDMADPEEEVGTNRWSPQNLPDLMPKARENADKLPNEVRVRLDGFGDVTMLVRKSDLPNAVAQAILLIGLPIPGGILNVLAPSDVPTHLMSRILGSGPNLHTRSNLWIDRAPTQDELAVYVKARIFDRSYETKEWLPEQAVIEFPRWNLVRPGEGLGVGARGLPLGQVVELYGEHAAEVALIGHTFVEVQIMPLPAEAPAPQADPPSPSPAP